MVIAMFKAEKRAGIDTDEYQKTAQRMMDLVTSMPGFISFKGARPTTARPSRWPRSKPRKHSRPGTIIRSIVRHKGGDTRSSTSPCG